MARWTNTGRTVAKYALLQLPEVLLLVLVLWLIDRWHPVASWVWAVLLAAWGVKVVALLPFVWSAYQDGPPAYSYSPVGAAAVAHEPIDPVGRVRLRGELWRAELVAEARPVAAGEPVRVIGSRGLTLEVAADEPDAPEAASDETAFG